MENQIQTLSDNLAQCIGEYKIKPTKASSLRLRKAILAVAKASPILRAELVEADKKGY